MAEPLTPRARQIVAVARELLEEEGAEALTMRRLGARLGIRASSLYKHLPSKAALEAAIITVGFEEAAAAFEAAAGNGTEPLATFAGAYRAFALAHPHLYRLMTEQPLPRDLLPEGLEQRAAAPLLHAMGETPPAPGPPSRSLTAWSCSSSPGGFRPVRTPVLPGRRASPPFRLARPRPAREPPPGSRTSPARAVQLSGYLLIGRPDPGHWSCSTWSPVRFPASVNRSFVAWQGVRADTRTYAEIRREARSPR